MAHQAQFMAKFADRQYAALFCEMGTGKTKMAIDFIRHSFQTAGGIRPVLIICPIIAMHNWADEFTKHSNVGGKVQVLDHKLKSKNIARMKVPGKAIYVVNFDKVTTLFDELVQIPWHVIVVDESHRIKNGKAVRTKDIIRLAPFSDKRLILTGTPVLNTEIDVYWQIFFLDGGKAFGPNFFAFRNKWFRDIFAYRKATNPGQHFPKFRLYEVFREDFQAHLNEMSFIKTTDECLDLPQQVYKVLRLHMGKEQCELYNTLKDEYIVSLLDKAAMLKIMEICGCIIDCWYDLWLIGLYDRSTYAPSAAVLQMRLNQMSSGFYKLDSGDEVRFKENPKIEAIKEIMADLPPEAKVIVWAVFRNNIGLLLDELAEFNPASIWGDTKDKRAEEHKFKTDKSCRIMIANPQSASVAINLVEACGAIYYSQGFSLEYRLQSEKRCHRIGSERHLSIWYVDLQYINSGDKIITQALREKKDISDMLMNPANWEDEE